MSNFKPQLRKNIVRIVVVSPGDVQAERDLVPSIIEDLNKAFGEAYGIRLEVLSWKTDAYPGFHLEGPQGLIDPALGIEDSDVVIAIFWKRFGTPTGDAGSGTEHEVLKACQAWKKSNRPQVMVYFNEEPYRPQTKAEADQLGEVIKFQESFPEEGLWWPYRGPAEFEKLLRKHLINLFVQSFKPRTEPAAEDDTAFFEPPEFANQVLRSSLLNTLTKEMKDNPVVRVEGLSGSGKTYLVTSYVTRERQAKNTGKALWHDPSPGETLDDFLAHITIEIPLSGFSTISRCKELLRILRKRNSLLVIDDYQDVDRASYSTLVNAAVRHKGPAQLILISKVYVDQLRNLPQVGRIEVRGFDLEEMRTFLANRDVAGLSRKTLETLIDKTDGLPLAASLFATLVRDFNRAPDDLLKLAMVKSDRLSGWFREVSSLIQEWERKLLTTLSVCDGPFNMSAVRFLGKREGLTEVDQAFLSLQRNYLVQRYSLYRWNIHHLIAMFCTSGLKEGDRKRIHLALGRYYLTVSRSPKISRSLPMSELEFTWRVRACRQYQFAKDHQRSQRILHDITKTAKTRGFYDTLMQLCEHEREAAPERSGWIDYDYAHCCLITGQLERGLDVIEPLTYALAKLGPEERVAYTRLYAEIKGSMGKVEFALDKLREVLAIVKPETVRPNVLAQAKSVEAWLLTGLKRYEQANEIAQKNLEDSLRREDSIGQAVALARIGIISQLSGYPERAQEKLSESASIFRSRGDRRGLAWTLSNIALVNLDLDNEYGAAKMLQQAIRIECDIGGCSTDYLLVLNSMKAKTTNKRILSLVDAELRRIGTIIDSRIRPPSSVSQFLPSPS